MPVLYLSKYIIENKKDYYRLMRNVTEHDEWEPWILYRLDALEETAHYTKDKIISIRDLIEETLRLAKQKLPERVYSKELIELLFQQPYCKITFLVNEGIASRNIASNYLNELTKIRILKKEKIGNEFVYLNIPLYELLTKQ